MLSDDVTYDTVWSYLRADAAPESTWRQFRDAERDEYLGIAVSNNLFETARYLLWSGATATVVYQGLPLLVWATSNANTRLMRLLLDYGVDINARGARDITALLEAIDIDRSMAPFDLLLTYPQLDCNTDGRLGSPLFRAAGARSHSDVKTLRLLQRGARIPYYASVHNRRASDKLVSRALAAGNYKTAIILYENGASAPPSYTLYAPDYQPESRIEVDELPPQPPPLPESELRPIDYERRSQPSYIVPEKDTIDDDLLLAFDGERIAPGVLEYPIRVPRF